MSWLIAAGASFAALIYTLTKKMRPLLLKTLLILLLLAALLFSLFKILFPMHEGPAPTGPHTVTTDRVFYTHETTLPGMGTNGNDREIPITLWLPQNTSQEVPLILFSHGSFGIEASNPALFTDLASHGYAVASLGHPHHSFTTTLSDGSRVFVDLSFFQDVINSEGAANPEQLLQDFSEWNAVRVEDMNFALDSLLTDPTYQNVLDENQVFLSGHSLGGSAALQLGRERAHEIRGIIALESPYFGDITGITGNEFTFTDEEYPLPVLHFYSDALCGQLDGISTYQMNQKLIEEGGDKFVNVHVEGSGHIGLTELSLTSPLITNLIDGGLNTRDALERVSEINAHALDFVRAHTD